MNKLRIPGYHIDIEKAAQLINRKGYKKVMLQIPEGLKTHASKIADIIEKATQATTLISADPCFGACDLLNHEIHSLNMDLIIHIGHLPIPEIKNPGTPTLFINAKSTRPIKNVVEKAMPLLEGKKIGLTTTAQHIHTLNKIKKILLEKNFKPVIGTGDKRIAEKGQILGCNFSTATVIRDKVDSFLFIGSGNFHPLGLMLTTKKTVIAADPYTNTVKKEELKMLKDKILRQRYAAIIQSKEAKQFAILITTKTGQQRIELAYTIKKMLNKQNKKAYILVLDNLSSTKLQGFSQIDCFISTACPRIAIDDHMQYKKPIITPPELEIILGKRTWDEYILDQILSK